MKTIIIAIMVLFTYNGFCQIINLIDTNKIKQEYESMILKTAAGSYEERIIKEGNLAISINNIFKNLFDSISVLYVSNENFSHTLGYVFFYNFDIIDTNYYREFNSFNDMFSKTNFRLNNLDKALFYILLNYRSVHGINPFYFNKKYVKKSYISGELNRGYVNLLYSWRETINLYKDLKKKKQIKHGRNIVQLPIGESKLDKNYYLLTFKFKKGQIIEMNSEKVLFNE